MSEQVIFIQPGTYNEQVYIPQLKGPLTIYGSTKDTTSYASNQVTITAKKALLNSANDDATATLRVWTTNFKMCKWESYTSPLLRQQTSR